MTSQKSAAARPPLPVLSPTTKRHRLPLLRTLSKVVPPPSRPAIPMLTVPIPISHLSPPPTTSPRKHQANDSQSCRRKSSLPRRRPSITPEISSPIDCPFVSKSRTPSLISDSGSEPSSPESQPSLNVPLRGSRYPVVLETDVHGHRPLDTIVGLDFATFWNPGCTKPPSQKNLFDFGDRNH